MNRSVYMYIHCIFARQILLNILPVMKPSFLPQDIQLFQLTLLD